MKWDCFNQYFGSLGSNLTQHVSNLIHDYLLHPTGFFETDPSGIIRSFKNSCGHGDILSEVIKNVLLLIPHLRYKWKIDDRNFPQLFANCKSCPCL